MMTSYLHCEKAVWSKQLEWLILVCHVPNQESLIFCFLGSNSSFTKPHCGRFRGPWLILICFLEQHPVASGQVHTVEFYGTVFLHRLQTRHVVLMNWWKPVRTEDTLIQHRASAEKRKATAKRESWAPHAHKYTEKWLSLHHVHTVSHGDALRPKLIVSW